MQGERTRCCSLALTGPPASQRLNRGTSTGSDDSSTGPVRCVGGWRLHLNCTGEARTSLPIVILEAGAGDFSVDWSLVQPGVARLRTCARMTAPDPGGASMVHGRGPCTKSSMSCTRCSTKLASGLRTCSSDTYSEARWCACINRGIPRMSSA